MTLNIERAPETHQTGARGARRVPIQKRLRHPLFAAPTRQNTAGCPKVPDIYLFHATYARIRTNLKIRDIGHLGHPTTSWRRR